MTRQYTISVGKSRMDKSWKVKEESWEQLSSRLAQCRKTLESVAEYKALTKEQKGTIKDIGGFVGGALAADGPRSASTIARRSMLTLDIDYGTPSTIGVVADALAGTAWCIYSTHSHTPEKPRYRLIVPLTRDVTPDEYVPIARRVADDIGIDQFDDSTYQPERLMYWPSCPVNGEFIYDSGEGQPLDADTALASYVDWGNANEWPLSSRVVKLTTRSGKKMEDPCTKPGIIGAFCRAYGIAEAIHTFIPDCYEQTDIPGRWTYLKGSTSAGAVVYDDKFLYSHHGTDPCCEREVNAFDLVRIHLFGDRDASSKPDTPVNKLPSFGAMTDFASEDDRTRRALMSDTLSQMSRDFGDAEYEGEGENLDWMAELQLDDRQRMMSSPHNFYLICSHDPAIRDATRYDVFAGRNRIQKDLPWAKMSPEHVNWDDNDDQGLIDYISRKYGGKKGIVVSKTALLDAHGLLMSQASYHPVREYLSSLKWDGIPRLDTLLIEYLGAADDVSGLTRAMTRKHLCAAVARVFEPGKKYDYILTFIGPEGIGKSTLVAKLGKEWYNDSFASSDVGDKSAMEQLRGSFLIEMGELTAYKRSTVEAFKAFISKQDDEYRPAYGRNKIVVPRQCVFFATTNEMAFLKGDTGNRRFWTVMTEEDLHTLRPADLTDEDVDQIWAEAVEYYKKGEKLYLEPALEEKARARQAAYNENIYDTRQGVIEAYIRMEIPLGWEDLSKAQRRDYFRTNTSPEGGQGKNRQMICVAEVENECFFTDKYTRDEARQITGILRSIPGIRYCDSQRMGVYGKQKAFEILPEFWSKNVSTKLSTEG